MTKKIQNIDISFYEIELCGSLFRLCPCYDADCFSSAVLRSLLLGDGREVAASLALSENDGVLKIKLQMLEDSGCFHI